MTRSRPRAFTLGARSRWHRHIALTVAVALAVALIPILWERDHTATAYFATSNGVYEGDEVRVLGVPIGTIEDIVPTGSGARFTLSYDSDVEIPAHARAAIIAPTLVSSRYVQLTPQYAGGPTLADGAVIPQSRTAVPVEFDEIKRQLNELAVALGPGGANADGSLSRFLTTSRVVLEGRGSDINRTIAQLNEAVSLLDTGGDDIFATVENLQTFVSALATSQHQVQEFGRRLDLVSAILAENRRSLRHGLQELAPAVEEVRSFVKQNRTSIVTTARGVSDVLATVASQRKALEQVLHVGPHALRNLYATYHSRENSIAAGMRTANTHNLRQLVCGAVGSVGPQAQRAAQQCARFAGPLLDQLSGDLSFSTQQLHKLEQLRELGGHR